MVKMVDEVLIFNLLYKKFQSAVVYLGEDLDRFNDVFGRVWNSICTT